MRAMLRAAVAACLLCLPSAAVGADLGPAYVPPAATADPPSHFVSGPYAGFLAGYDISTVAAAGFTFSGDALQAGGFVGYQQRIGGYVYGIEGDYVFEDVKAALAAGVLSTSNKYLATIRARAGIPFSHTMVYVTAGPAFTSQTATVGAASASSLLTGIAYGGGMEMEVTKTLFVRLEAIHYDFPSQDVGLLSSKDQQTTARVGMGLRF